jgi:hypothetical protein
MGNGKGCPEQPCYELHFTHTPEDVGNDKVWKPALR